MVDKNKERKVVLKLIEMTEQGELTWLEVLDNTIRSIPESTVYTTTYAGNVIKIIGLKHDPIGTISIIRKLSGGTVGNASSLEILGPRGQTIFRFNNYNAINDLWQLITTGGITNVEKFFDDILGQ